MLHDLELINISMTFNSLSYYNILHEDNHTCFCQDGSIGEEPDLGLLGTYRVLATILNKPTVKQLIAVLLTCKVIYILLCTKIICYGVDAVQLLTVAIFCH